MGWKGGEIKISEVTVSGTDTALMAAALAHGTTVIDAAQGQLEIGDVADRLNKMGARISGIGTICAPLSRAVTRLGGARHRVLPDWIEIGTYAMAVAMTGGDVLLEGARPGSRPQKRSSDVIGQTGAEIDHPNDTASGVKRNGQDHSRRTRTNTAPFPIFRPTCRRSSWCL